MLCVAVPIIDDLTVENTENFAVELSLTPSNDPIDFSPQQSTVTIFDDDGKITYTTNQIINEWVEKLDNDLSTIHSRSLESSEAVDFAWTVF